VSTTLIHPGSAFRLGSWVLGGSCFWFGQHVCWASVILLAAPG
jgi:hypothetical protein